VTVVRALAASALLALVPGAALAGPGAARELLRRSGLEAQLTQVEGAVRVAILEHARGESDARRVGRALDAARRAFASERLRATVARHLATLDRTSARAALAFLRSPAGRRATRAEVAASEPEALAAEEDSRFGAGPPLSAARSELIARLERASGGGQARLELDLRLATAMLEGALLARPELAAAVPRLERTGSEVQAAQLEAYREAARREDARVYRELTDEELARYVEFAESPAGRRYQAAVRSALLAALEEAGRQFGELLAGERAA
jgi:hypothetical protein